MRPAPPRSESGEEPRGARERVVTTACRARVGAWGVLPVAGNEGAACAHARVPRDPGSPRSPEGAHAPRSGRGAERKERGWVAVGSRAPPVHRPCPAASGPSRASPSLPFPRTAASPRASRACVARVVCRVEVASLPPPRQRSHGWGEAVDPSLLVVGDPVLALRGRDLSLGCGLWRERRSVVSRRVAGRVGARRRRGPSSGGGGRVCLGGGSVREEGARGQASRVSGTSRGQEA